MCMWISKVLCICQCCGVECGPGGLFDWRTIFGNHSGMYFSRRSRDVSCVGFFFEMQFRGLLFFWMCIYCFEMTFSWHVCTTSTLEQSVLRRPVCWFALACWKPLLFFWRHFSARARGGFGTHDSDFARRNIDGKECFAPPFRQCGECHKWPVEWLHRRVIWLVETVPSKAILF